MNCIFVTRFVGKGEVHSSILCGSTRFPKQRQRLPIQALPCPPLPVIEQGVNPPAKLGENAGTLFGNCSGNVDRFCSKAAAQLTVDRTKKVPIFWCRKAPHLGRLAGTPDLIHRDNGWFEILPKCIGGPTGAFSRLKADPAWRVVAGSLTEAEVHLATVGAEHVTRIKALIKRHHPPVDVVGGYRFPDAPNIDISPNAPNTSKPACSTLMMPSQREGHNGRPLRPRF
jgi:hypothetical protein